MSAPYASAAPCVAFDALADNYDQMFTSSLIGRAQRDAVWSYARDIWTYGDHILELNCGTGEDALFFARRGVSVTACDSSPRMLEIAASRMLSEIPSAPVTFRLLPNEQIERLLPTHFSGVFSNFSGLNCVANLHRVARSLARLLSPGASTLLCFSTRFCLAETAWYLFHADVRRAFRRWSRHTVAKIGEHDVHVWYHTVRRIRSLFSPWFDLVNIKGIGVLVPPSYVEPWARRMPRALTALERLDARFSSWPALRTIGDHVLLHMERTAA